MFITVVQTISNYAIPMVILLIPLYAVFKKVKVYEVFCEGAVEGFQTAVRIIPYLLAMLVAIEIRICPSEPNAEPGTRATPAFSIK